MRGHSWSWAYWALFGLGMGAVTALSTLVVWRLRHAYYVDRLTRDTLVDALVLSLAVLLCLLVSGWAFVSRPKRSERPENDALWA